MLFGPSVIIALFAVATALPIDHDAMTQSDVNNALDSMISGDANGAAPGDIVLDYQNEASHSHFDHDNAKDPFFKSISAALLAKPTYVAFNALTATYTTPSIDAADPNTPARNTAIDAWFAAIKTTVPFQSMWTYLKTQKIASSDYPTFVTALKALWFTPYGTGDAGFKEVFSGAVKGTNVVGFANWVQFYQLEQTKALNYHGWFNRDKAAEIALQFAWGNFEAVEQSMLIGTSPEFEFSAYTLMALSGHLTATFNYASYSIDLTVKTVSDSGFVRMGAAFPGHGSGNTNPTSPPHKGTTKKSSHGSNPGLQALIDSMVAADVDAPSATDVVMNWGNKVKGTTDESKDPLFTHVNEDLFKRPVYSKLIDVWNANVFNPQVCTAEVAMSGNKKALLDAVTKVFVNTTVFGLAHDYLVKEGVTSGTIDAFYPTLFQLWFGTYSRCHGALGSSGWEHVFSGEWKGSEIDGQHDWPRYYLLEKAGKINYHGYDSHDDNLIGTFQYTWQTYLKKIGGFFTGTSPVFDFSAFTVCALTSSGANGCKFNVKGFPIGVTSYTQSCAGGSCLSTSYPSN